MSEIADLVRQLIDAGTPPDVAAIVTAEAFARGAAARNSGGIPPDRAAEKRRAWDRERKRNSGGIPVESGGIPQNALSLSESKKEKKERAIGKVCPVEFRPSESHYDAGVRLGLGRPKVDDLCADMRSWSLANSNRQVARKSDWGLALHQWLKRYAAENPSQSDFKYNGGMEGIV